VSRLDILPLILTYFQPVDCLLYGAAEMFLSPEVAIVQHSTGVMQVVNDYFENGITFFTNLVYTSIRYSIGCGEVAPFVGHNAFLRWQGKLLPRTDSLVTEA
jgi:hypothetical protein